MANRADQKIDYATKQKKVAGGTILEGGLVKFGADDNTVLPGIVDDLGIGIALKGALSGESVEILLFGPVARVKVGNGGATRGEKAVYTVTTATGFTDAAAHDSDGTGNATTHGIFMNSGVSGDFVGMQLIAGNRGA